MKVAMYTMASFCFKKKQKLFSRPIASSLRVFELRTRELHIQPSVRFTNLVSLLTVSVQLHIHLWKDLSCNLASKICTITTCLPIHLHTGSSQRRAAGQQPCGWCLFLQTFSTVAHSQRSVNAHSSVKTNNLERLWFNLTDNLERL